MRNGRSGDCGDGGFGGAKRRVADERAAEAATVPATEEGEVKRVMGLENGDDQGNGQNGHVCLGVLCVEENQPRFVPSVQLGGLREVFF